MVEIKNSVIKFGGTSVANETEIIKTIVSENNPRYVVVSAPGKRNSSDEKVTDMLIRWDKDDRNLSHLEIIDRFKGLGDDSKLVEIEQELLRRTSQPNSSQRYEDIISFGEWASAKVLAPVLKLPFYDPKDFIRIKNKRFKETFNSNRVPKFAVVPGFYGSNLEGKIETFTRGGSDITGAIIANKFKLAYHNFTDSGVKVVDPRLIENPNEISEMTYRELRYLTLSGFSIIHEDVWKLMEDAKLPLIVRGTKNYPNNGTQVTNKKVLRNANEPITAITYRDGFIKINVDSRETENRGFNKSIFSLFDEFNINITADSGGLTDTTLLINENELTLSKLKQLEIELRKKGYEVKNKTNLACMVVVGEELKENIGILGKISSLISESNNNISFVSQSGCEKSIVYGINGGNEGKRTLNHLYNYFLK